MNILVDFVYKTRRGGHMTRVIHSSQMSTMLRDFLSKKKECRVYKHGDVYAPENCIGGVEFVGNDQEPHEQWTLWRHLQP